MEERPAARAVSDARKLKDRAVQLVAGGKLDKAAAVYRELLEAQPDDANLRRQLGDVLRRAGDGAAAVAEYQRAADVFARDGFLLRAIAVCKVILEVDPAHQQTQATLAELYAAKGLPAAPAAAPAPRGEAAVAAALAGEPATATALPPIERGRPAAAPPPADPPAEVDVDVELDPRAPTPFEGLVDAAAQARRAGVEEEFAIDVDEPAPVPLPESPAAVLPRHPLFSDLSPGAFQALTGGLEVRRAAAGEVVLRQGDPGDRFFAVAQGLLRVERAAPGGERVVVGMLEDGAFFGEMALLSGEPRAASVIAETEAELVVIRADVLTELCRQHPHVADSVGKFYRERLLANALATSPLFHPFTPGEREAISRLFRTVRLPAGRRVIAEGLPSDGLYVVLSGALAVLRRAGSRDVQAGELREGDVFGEMSCLRKTPASATVVARRAVTLLQLPRARFDELIVTYPQILELVAGLADERQRSLDALDAAVAVHPAPRQAGVVLV